VAAIVSVAAAGLSVKKRPPSVEKEQEEMSF
jgi:hypothetical protein